VFYWLPSGAYAAPTGVTAGLTPSLRLNSIEALARQCAAQSMEAPVKIAPSRTARVAAATAILDRAFGRPFQTFAQRADQKAPTLFQTGL
jgi:hypothetical protein